MQVRVSKNACRCLNQVVEDAATLTAAPRAKNAADFLGATNFVGIYTIFLDLGPIVLEQQLFDANSTSLDSQHRCCHKGLHW